MKLYPMNVDMVGFSQWDHWTPFLGFPFLPTFNSHRGTVIHGFTIPPISENQRSLQKKGPRLLMGYNHGIQMDLMGII